MLKLARSLSGLRQIIETVLASISQIMNLFMILFLVMFIFALLGMEMFRGQYTEDKGFAPMVKSYGGALAPPGAVVPEPYVHFDNFYFSMVTIFVVISGENWNDVYFTGFQATAHPRWTTCPLGMASRSRGLHHSVQRNRFCLQCLHLLRHDPQLVVR